MSVSKNNFIPIAKYPHRISGFNMQISAFIAMRNDPGIDTAFFVYCFSVMIEWKNARTLQYDFLGSMSNPVGKQNMKARNQ
ncbi:hypothetical protein, partial [Breznakibacter xylanolyticus]|uniref:hypothetical protein n=1 Tax=Breznakibacter xylanolyticus TaxID=990 RepID=UPI001C896C16